MDKKVAKRREQRVRRSRAGIIGSAERPRLSVFRSNKHMYAQLIDDILSKTLVAASTTELKAKGKKEPKVKSAGEVGKLLAEKAKKAGIKSVVFDRRFYKYHGRVKAVAEGAREGGLIF